MRGLGNVPRWQTKVLGGPVYTWIVMIVDDPEAEFGNVHQGFDVRIAIDDPTGARILEAGITSPNILGSSTRLPDKSTLNVQLEMPTTVEGAYKIEARVFDSTGLIGLEERLLFVMDD